jgi:hypothetical protein
MYKVIHFFTDLQDNAHPYNVGDTFPRKGVQVDKARLKELAGSDNRQGRPLIVGDEPVDSVAGDSKPAAKTRKKKSCG